MDFLNRALQIHMYWSAAIVAPAVKVVYVAVIEHGAKLGRFSAYRATKHEAPTFFCIVRQA